MSQQNFETKKAVIEAIDDKLVAEPQMPVGVMVQEAENLHAWCLEDQEVLTKAGLDWTLATDLPLRAGACRYAQSNWQKDYQSLEDSQKEWNEQSPIAIELRDELLHHFFHAYYAETDLYAKTQKIAEGSGNADLMQDLSDLAVLGKANTAPLTKVGVDLTLLDRAASTSSTLSTLLAQVNGDRLSTNKTKIIRDKAYTHLKQAVDEIRRNGQYAFYRNENRKKGYVSKYIRKKKNQQ